MSPVAGAADEMTGTSTPLIAPRSTRNAVAAVDNWAVWAGSTRIREVVVSV